MIKSVKIEGDCCWELTSVHVNEEDEIIDPKDGLTGSRSFKVSKILAIEAIEECTASTTDVETTSISPEEVSSTTSVTSTTVYDKTTGKRIFDSSVRDDTVKT